MTPDLQAAYAQARHLIEQERWHEAEPLLEQVLQAFPEIPELRVALGQCRQRRLWGDALLSDGTLSEPRYQRWIRHHEPPLGDPLQPLRHDWWELVSGPQGQPCWSPSHGGVPFPAEAWPRSGWLVCRHPHSQLREGALPWLEHWLAEAAAQDPDLIYGDEDHLNAAGLRHSPWWKPGYSLESFCSSPWLEGLSLWRISWLRKQALPLPPLDLDARWLWVLQALLRQPVVSAVPAVLSHWLPNQPVQDPSPQQRRAQALAAFLDDQDECGVQVEPHRAVAGGFRLQWPLPSGLRCRVVIPTRDRADLLDRCLHTLWQTRGLAAGNVALELVVLDNGSEEAATAELLQRWAERLGPCFTVICDERRFNWSALNNRAVAGAPSDLLLFLNNDIEALQPGWLEAMAAQALRPAVGAVGAVLLYPNGRIQHAGVATGLKGLADHVYAGLPHAAPVHRCRPQLLTSWGAVTGACLMLRRELFEQAGGFDEGFPVEFNDLELCLRLSQQGYRHVVVPEAVLIHHESQSRTVVGSSTEQEAVRRIKALWGRRLKQRDPAWPLQCDPEAADGRPLGMRWMI